MGERLSVVLIGQDTACLHAVDRGYATAGCRVLDVLHAIAAQDNRPVRLGVICIFGENLLENAHGLVVLACAAEVVAAVVEIGATVVVEARQGLLRAAIVAGDARGTLGHFERGAAHFALECCHG